MFALNFNPENPYCAGKVLLVLKSCATYFVVRPLIYASSEVEG